MVEVPHRWIADGMLDNDRVLAINGRPIVGKIQLHAKLVDASVKDLLAEISHRRLLPGIASPGNESSQFPSGVGELTVYPPALVVGPTKLPRSIDCRSYGGIKYDRHEVDRSRSLTHCCTEYAKKEDGYSFQ